jgi:hypothetical protein
LRKHGAFAVHQNGQLIWLAVGVLAIFDFAQSRRAASALQLLQ